MSDRVSTITALMWVQKSPRDPTSWSRYRRGSATVTLCSERELPGKSNAERTLHCGPCLPGGSMHALASSLQWPPHRLHAALHDEADNIVSTGTGDHRLPSILTQRRACSSLVLLGGGGGRGPTQQQGVIYPLQERLLRSRSRLLNVHALHRLLGKCWACYRAEGGSWAVYLPAAVLRRLVRGSEASLC